MGIWISKSCQIIKRLSASLFKKLLEHNPFQKRLDRKPVTTLGFDEKLIPEPYRRDKPAQRLQQTFLKKG